ncbi:MAG TPA: FecR domain-containing protein, partial [Candidatus Tumulicola sp.]|nr:FecR domain-containing protein [Candidatus Tumulicola sp.]
SDNSLLSAGPNSELALDQYSFDPTTNEGRFDTKLSKGTLAVVSGRIAKQSPKAMTVRTPGATLGVRGTEFVVSADDGRSVR